MRVERRQMKKWLFDVSIELTQIYWSTRHVEKVHVLIDSNDGKNLNIDRQFVAAAGIARIAIALCVCDDAAL